MSGSSEEPHNVSIYFHNVPASLLQEFAKKIAGPYFGDDWNEAFRALMDSAFGK